MLKLPGFNPTPSILSSNDFRIAFLIMLYAVLTSASMIDGFFQPLYIHEAFFCIFVIGSRPLQLL
jgi:hypothetical protein